MRREAPELSILIVHYRTYDLTKQTLDSVLAESRGFSYEIILIDNHSADGSFERLESDYREEIGEGRIVPISNTENQGFSKANNLGAKVAKGRYLLLLNSDTELVGNTIGDCLREIKEDECVGALGCRLILTDGKLDHACKRGFPTPAAALFYFAKLHRLFPRSGVFAAYTAGHLSEDRSAEVDCLSGAFMLMRKEAFEEAGRLSEAYFMYGEDVELCWKLREKGWKVRYFSGATLIHHKGGSGKKNPKVLYAFYEAMKIFYERNLQERYPRFMKRLIFFAVDIAYHRAERKNLRG